MVLNPHGFPRSRIDEWPNDEIAWEFWMVRNAAYFTVARRIEMTLFDVRAFDTFEDATKNAENDERALVYAVAESGHYICIERIDWHQFLPKYLEHPPAGFSRVLYDKRYGKGGRLHGKNLSGRSTTG